MQIPELNENVYEISFYHSSFKCPISQAFCLLYLEQMFSFFAKLFYDVYVLQILLYPYSLFRSYILHYARKILSICLLHFFATYNYA